MLFNSLTFVVFFALVVGAYWTLRSWEVRKNLLLVASYIFYGTWNPPFAILLFATTALDFYLGRTDREGRHAQIAPRSGWSQAWLEPQHAGLFQIRKFPAGKLQVAGRSSRPQLSAAAPRSFPPDRDFVLHLPFALLHAGCLSRHDPAHAFAARLRPRRLVLPATCRRSHRARGGFSAAGCASADARTRAVSSGACCS